MSMAVRDRFAVSGRASARGKLGGETIALAAVVSSFFYVLPLGRYNIGGFDTDTRLYDVLSVAFFYLYGIRLLPRLRKSWIRRSRLYGPTVVLLGLVWSSLCVTFFIGGVAAVLPAVVRAFRLTMYFLTALFILLLVTTPARYRFMLGVVFANIVVQAVLAFAQGVGWLPNFWPEYWLSNAFRNAPVATLSPHHLQIGVMMLFGIALSAAFIRNARSLFLRTLLLGLIAIMVAVPILGGTRTIWIAGAGGLVAFVFVHARGGRGIRELFVGVVALGAVFWIAGPTINLTLRSSIEQRVVERVEKFGLESVIDERTNVYFRDYPAAITRNPWILLIGYGFQNSGNVLGSTGAHNNYFHVWFELGIVGLVVYLIVLRNIFRRLLRASSVASRLERNVAKDCLVAFIAVLVTMLGGETLWAQYSLFTLTGQVLTILALAMSPLNWNSVPA